MGIVLHVQASPLWDWAGEGHYDFVDFAVFLLRLLFTCLLLSASTGKLAFANMRGLVAIAMSLLIPISFSDPHRCNLRNYKSPLAAIATEVAHCSAVSTLPCTPTTLQRQLRVKHPGRGCKSRCDRAFLPHVEHVARQPVRRCADTVLV